MNPAPPLVPVESFIAASAASGQAAFASLSTASSAVLQSPTQTMASQAGAVRPTRVLLIDDDEDEWLITRDLLREVESPPRLLQRGEGEGASEGSHGSPSPRFSLDWVATYEAGLQAVAQARHDVYLVDYRLGTRSGLELLGEAKKLGTAAPLILLTGQGDPDVDVAATQAGAADYLVKEGLDAALLERAIRYALAQTGAASALREIARQNERLSAAIDTAELGVIIAEKRGEEWIISFANAAFESISGTPLSRVVGQPFTFLHNDVSDPAIAGQMREAIAGVRGFECIALSRRGDGAVFWNATQISPVKNQAGEAETWIGFIRDVSAQIEADQALRESRESLAAAQRVTHLGSWTAELDWRSGAAEDSEDEKVEGEKVEDEEVGNWAGGETGKRVPYLARLTWSDEVFRILGLEPRHFQPTPDLYLSALHPDDRAGAASISTTLGRGENFEQIHRIIRPGGEERVVQVRAEIDLAAHPPLSSGGADAHPVPPMPQTQSVIGTMLDVTERVRAENLARQSQERLQSVVQNAPLLIWSLDGGGEISFIEGRALESLGLNPEDVLSTPDSGALDSGALDSGASESGASESGAPDGERLGLPPILLPIIAPSDSRVFKGEEVCGLVEVEGLWFETKVSPLRDASNRISGAVGVATDVSERVRAERLLDESQARLTRIVSNVPGMVYRFHRTPEGAMSFSEVSEGCREIYGVSAQEVLRDALVLVDVIHPEDTPRFIDSVLVSERTLEPWVWQGRVLHSSGQTRWIRGQARPTRASDGSTIWDGLVVDITENHRVQEELIRSRNAFDEAQKLARLGSFEWNLSTGEVKWSDQMFRLLGFEPQSFTPSYDTILGFIHPGEREEVQKQAHQAIEQARPATLLIRVVCHDGSERFWQTLSRVETDGAGTPVHLVGSAQDVTESVAAQQALRESEQRYALAAQGANDGLWDWNLRSNCIYLSPRWKKMIGHEESEIGDNPDEWFSRVHPDDIDTLRSTLSQHLEGQSAHFECQYRLLASDGRYLWMLGRGLAVTDEAGQAHRIAGSQTDISQRKTSEEQLSRNAFYDTLTGLPNRALFLDRLQRTLTRAARHPEYAFAVLFLDIDRFKKINDSLGHLPGDQLLIQAAARFEVCLRPGDTVARLGGDEFAILLDDIGGTDAIEQVAGRIQKELEPPFTLGNREVFVTVSIGIAPSQGGLEQPDELLRNADTAMYRAKSLGRARHEVFDAGMHQRAVKMLELESDLWRAVERDELRLFFQPIISLFDGQIQGFEALVRWQHPQRGLVAPSEFIPLAEETGLIVPIDWWVLSRACAQAQAWQQKYEREAPFFMSVNLNSKQFSQPLMVEQVRDIVAQTGFNSRFLKLEITETVIMENTDSASTMLLQLKAMGIRLSLDDFGTGYSSLSYLHRFPLDTLKIDRSFVSQMRVHPKNREIIGTIIALANGLSMNVVAEGVETQEQLAGLRKLGCGYAQGFLFSPPVPGEQIETLLNSKPRW